MLQKTSEYLMSYGSCQEILTKVLGMSRIAAKFVPRLLTNKKNKTEVHLSKTF